MKLREADRQQRRAELAEAFHADSVLREQGLQLKRDIEEAEMRSRVMSSPGRVKVDQVLDTHRYKLLLKSQVELLHQKQQQIQGEIERRREALAVADRDVRILEKLRERKLEEYTAAELQREVKAMDEVAVQRWGLRQESI